MCTRLIPRYWIADLSSLLRYCHQRVKDPLVIIGSWSYIIKGNNDGRANGVVVNQVLLT